MAEGPFIATQLNSTQLNSTSSRVELSWRSVYSDPPTQLNSTLNWVELRRYKRAFRCNYLRFGKTTVRHIQILLPVSILTTSPQSVCYSAPVCEILSKSTAEKLRHVNFKDGGSPPSLILGVQ